MVPVGIQFCLSVSAFKELHLFTNIAVLHCLASGLEVWSVHLVFLKDRSRSKKCASDRPEFNGTQLCWWLMLFSTLVGVTELQGILGKA